MMPGNKYYKQNQAHRRAVEGLREEIASIVRLLRFSYEAIISIDESQRIVLFNNGAEEIFGYSSGELLGHSIEILIPERFRVIHKKHVEEFSRIEKSDMKMHHHKSVFGLRKNGEEFPVESSLYKYRYGGVTTFTAVMRDITHDAEMKENLLKLATHDYLTGLPNRLLFDDRLSTAISRAERTHKKLALFFIDMDNFKSINDRLGHASGDEFLKIIGERLHSCARESDTVARIGGDEFAMIIENLDDHQDAKKKFLKLIRDSIENVISLDGEDVMPLISVGIALYPDDADNADQLLKEADSAMFENKLSRGRSERNELG